MGGLICPVCGAALAADIRTFRCANGHSFDRARQGYVNLLLRGGSSKKRHGDDRRMVAARRTFLDGGYYAPLRDLLCELAVRYAPSPADLLDAGCGEGYYTAAVRAALDAAGKSGAAVGIDISRTALIAASGRDASLSLAVASVSALPVADGDCGVLLSVFAPEDAREFRRALRPGGLLLKAVPTERHLWGLKAAVYERPYLNPPPHYAPDGFALLERRTLGGSVELTPPQIENLFMMTPYYYKTGAADQAKLAALPRLETEIGFAVFALRRQ